MWLSPRLPRALKTASSTERPSDFSTNLTALNATLTVQPRMVLGVARGRGTCDTHLTQIHNWTVAEGSSYCSVNMCMFKSSGF